MNPARPFNLKKVRDDGFTFIELLIVLAVVAILSLCLLPAVAGTKPNSQAFQCLGSLRQLLLGWQMYSADNSGWLAPNGNESSEPATLAAAQAGTDAQWCPGRQDLTSQLSPAGTPTASNVGDEWIASGVIFPYVKNPLIYHCPADNSSSSAFGLTYPHVRSRSMNAWMSPIAPYNNISAVVSYYKESALISPGTASLWVFIDENPLSINDGSFICEPQVNEWIDCPASYHNGAGGLSFADGHAVIHKWTDPTVLKTWAEPTIQPGNPTFTELPPASALYPDLPFLQAASTAVVP